MPDDPTDVRERIETGCRLEQSGALDRALACYEAAERGAGDPADRAEAIWHQSSVYRQKCEWETALDAARRAAAVAREHGVVAQLAQALNAEAAVFQSTGQYAQATGLLEQVLALTDEPRMRGVALQNLGAIHAQMGALGRAERLFAESFGAFQRAGYRRGEAFALNNYGRAALDRGNTALATEVLRQAIDTAKAVGDSEVQALATLNIAEAIAAGGDIEEAEDLASQALGYFHASTNTWRQIECLRLLGDLNSRRGAIDSASACYRQALEMAERIGAEPEAAALRGRLSALLRS